MDDLEKQKQLAAEAAESDLLWEIGMLVPSSNQARWICEALSLGVSDEKRVKAVMRLREENSQTLSEIRSDSVEDEEETMAKVVWGSFHYDKIRIGKELELWKMIFATCGITRFREGLELPQTRLYIEGGSQTRNSGFSVYQSNPRGIVIKIETVGHAFGQPAKPDLTDTHGAPKFFYQFPHVEANGSKFPSEWSPAGIFVFNRKFLPLAKRLAEGYERETKRRRKPAKAVVVKNY